MHYVRFIESWVMKIGFNNMVLLVIVIAMLTALAFFVKVTATADTVAVISTGGMTCSSCADDIAKALQAKTGVASVEVDVNGGLVVVGYDSKMIKPEVIAYTVAGMGYVNRIAELLSVERFRALTGRDPGAAAKTTGCGGRCCNRNMTNRNKGEKE